MAGFNFKLEKVLNYKETVENEKKTKFAQIKQRLHKEELLLDDYYKQKNQLLKKKIHSMKILKLENCTYIICT